MNALFLKRKISPLCLLLLILPATSVLCQHSTEIATCIGHSMQPADPKITPSANASSSLTYEYYIEILNQQTPVELRYNNEVGHYINLFLTKHRADLELALQRAQLYFPIIEEQLDRFDLPLELKYIAVIESGLDPFAKSPSGAVGLWQFLYNTCSLFDLKVDSYIDERRDPYISTIAACRYLKYLYNTFNDWNLVMASYNGGPRDVRNAIQRAGGKTDYWSLQPYLSEQSRNYIPKFIALNYLMNYYTFYGIQAKQAEFAFPNTDTLHIQYAVSFDQISSVLEISVTDLERLNPVYKKNYVPDLITPCVLVLPSTLIPKYLKYENQILGYTKPVTDYNTLVAIAGSTENRTKITHIVQPGEYYHKIALTYNCTIENIKAWNNLNDSPLYPGQSLVIWIENRENEDLFSGSVANYRFF
jgi:membrane-bound lytic murein transglycosylase D